MKNEQAITDMVEDVITKDEVTKDADGVYVHRFKEPFSYQGKVFESMTFDFNKLTGRDHLDVENEMQAQGKLLVNEKFSGEFIIRIAARACTEKVGSDAFVLMPMHEYSKIRSEVRSFI